MKPVSSLFCVFLVAGATALVILPRPEMKQKAMEEFSSLTSVLDTLPSAIFDENLVRHKMYPMAAAAYSDSPDKCVKNVFNNATFVRQVTKVCDWDHDDTCSAFVAVSHDDRAIIIAYRGTTNFIQLITEAGETLNEHIEFLTGGKGSVSGLRALGYGTFVGRRDGQFVCCFGGKTRIGEAGEREAGHAGTAEDRKQGLCASARSTAQLHVPGGPQTGHGASSAHPRLRELPPPQIRGLVRQQHVAFDNSHKHLLC
ncbi:hypothetical protein L596_011767 [Steinernema carpocapsae]|uniref:Fungal lipase-like domain-containing protein n=1 Tax=Steinernema carpocapsae TaxID=34508 RepID=A0A4U5NUZ0_STECR|nr:hypothetical protein L596_011767 [Steinernema carpocapsae]